MPVDVKSYLASMKSISSQTTSNIKSGVANQQDLKLQALLAQLIEALSYANSMKINRKALKETSQDKKEVKEIIDQMKSQEKLIEQLANGQALSKEQGETLTKSIDKFYEITSVAEVNYKKFAENMEKFAMEDLPEAVKNRVINDSRDAHMIGKKQLDEEAPVIKTLKKIKNYIEDTMENTKQFRKKLFVNLDQFKEGLFDAFNKLGEEIASGDIISKLLKNLSGLGTLGFVLQGFIKEGQYGIPMIVKQFKNLQTAMKAFKEVGGLGKGIAKSFETAKNMAKGIRMIAQQFKFLPKLIEKFGLGKGLGAAAKGIGKGLAKGLGKTALKKIPLIGSLISIWMAIDRWQKGDKLGSLIEIGSGIAAIFPGLGTLVSIGLDLINLGRDTGFFKNMKEKAESKLPNLSENILMSIPVIGQIFGLKKTFDLWKAGDKIGALKMATKSLVSLMPGGAWIFDIFDKLVSTDFSISQSDTTTTQKGSTIETSNSGFGSAVSSISQYGDGDSSGTPINFGDKLAAAADSAKRPKSTGYCGKYVGNAVEKVLGKSVAGALRGNGKDWATKLQGPVGKKYFDFWGRTQKQDKLPAGSIVSWPAVSGHPYGHVEISDGKGHLISDFSRDARKYPASGYIGTKPYTFVPKDVDRSLIASTADQIVSGVNESSESAVVNTINENVEDETQPNIQTYDDALSAYTSFMDNIQAQISSTEGAQLSSDKTWAKPVDIKSMSNSIEAPVEPLQQIANKQQQTIAIAPSIQSQPSSMTTDVHDTALAILNSVLFK